jgi:hypothetical protein
MNSFKVVRVASEIAGMSKEEIELLADLLIDNSNADDLQFQINIKIHENLLTKDELV